MRHLLWTGLLIALLACTNVIAQDPQNANQAGAVTDPHQTNPGEASSESLPFPPTGNKADEVAATNSPVAEPPQTSQQQPPAENVSNAPESVSTAPNESSTQLESQLSEPEKSETTTTANLSAQPQEQANPGSTAGTPAEAEAQPKSQSTNADQSSQEQESNASAQTSGQTEAKSSEQAAQEEKSNSETVPSKPEPTSTESMGQPVAPMGEKQTSTESNVDVEGPPGESSGAAEGSQTTAEPVDQVAEENSGVPVPGENVETAANEGDDHAHDKEGKEFSREFKPDPSSEPAPTEATQEVPVEDSMANFEAFDEHDEPMVEEKPETPGVSVAYGLLIGVVFAAASVIGVFVWKRRASQPKKSSKPGYTFPRDLEYDADVPDSESEMSELLEENAYRPPSTF